MIEGEWEPDGERDPQYPTLTPPDPVYPGQTRAPLGTPLDAIATPAMWSRFSGPLSRALMALWDGVGLLERARPAQLVAIHYGRIALNAHAWERLVSRHRGEAADPALVEDPASGLEALAERWERARVRWRSRSFARRLESASERRMQCLERTSRLDLAECDTAELARGPLDDVMWCEILLPWLGDRLESEPTTQPDPAVLAGISLEQRAAAELGQRLEARGAVNSPADVAYLTVPERIRAVHEDCGPWAELAAERLARVDQFTKLDVPIAFWGRPRIGAENSDVVGY